MAELLEGDFVALCAATPETTWRRWAPVAVVELPLGITNEATLTAAMTAGRLLPFEIRARGERDEVVANVMLIGEGELWRLAVLPEIGDRSLEEIEDILGLTLAAGFRRTPAQSILMFLDRAHGRYLWSLMRFGFEWTDDETGEQLDRAAVIMRRANFGRVLPWGTALNLEE